MKFLQNPYVKSIATAIITGSAVAFIILLAGKWLSSESFVGSTQIPLYYASEPVRLSAVPSTIGQNVDDETTGILPISTPTAPTSTPISAPSYLVVELNASTSIPEKIIAEKDNLRALPIASLTKLATAVVAENLLDQNAPVTITRKIISTYHNDPGNFRLDEQIKVGGLLYPLLMVSSNDAGEALAQSYPEGREWFIKSMNDWAYSVGAYNTYFADPTGLSPENISSPHDLAIMLAWIYSHRPDLVNITTTKVKYLGAHTWTSPTQLLNLSSYIAGKNGYLPEAGQTSVSLFKINTPTVPHLYIVVTLGSAHRDQDVLALLHKI